MYDQRRSGMTEHELPTCWAQHITERPRISWNTRALPTNVIAGTTILAPALHWAFLPVVTSLTRTFTWHAFPSVLTITRAVHVTAGDVVYTALTGQQAILAVFISCNYCNNIMCIYICNVRHIADFFYHKCVIIKAQNSRRLLCKSVMDVFGVRMKTNRAKFESDCLDDGDGPQDKVKNNTWKKTEHAFVKNDGLVKACEDALDWLTGNLKGMKWCEVRLSTTKSFGIQKK